MREYETPCVVCGTLIRFRRKQSISPAMLKEIPHYCPQCKSNRLKGRPATNARAENRYMDSFGYIRIKVNGVHVLEHRYIMEQLLGRKLERNEIIHHIDGDVTNNNPDNLMVEGSSEHKRYHALENKHCSASKLN